MTIQIVAAFTESSSAKPVKPHSSPAVTESRSVHRSARPGFSRCGPCAIPP
jgi:hypothetical protein